VQTEKVEQNPAPQQRGRKPGSKNKPVTNSSIGGTLLPPRKSGR
jgi:hypothetical protein